MKFMRPTRLVALLLGTSLSASVAFAKSPSLSSSAPLATQVNVASNETQANSSSSMQLQNDGISDRKGFGLSAGIEYAQKNAVAEKGARESETNLVLSPAYTINSNFAFSAKAIVTKQNSGAKDTTYSNTTLGLAVAGVQFNEQFRSIHSVSGVIPTSKDNRQTDRLNGALAIKNGIAFDYSIISLKYSFTVSQNFHEYNFNAEGDANIQYRLAQALELSLAVTDQFYITAAGIYREGRTYGGFARSAFGIDADLNYDLTKNVSINLGTSNEGSAFKSNGVDSNISAYDENSSVLRAGMSYVY